MTSLPLNHSRRIVVSYMRKYVHEVLVNCLLKLAQENSVVRRTGRPAMTIAVDLGDVNKTNKPSQPYSSSVRENLSLGVCEQKKAQTSLRIRTV